MLHALAEATVRSALGLLAVPGLPVVALAVAAALVVPVAAAVALVAGSAEVYPVVALGPATLELRELMLLAAVVASVLEGPEVLVHPEEPVDLALMQPEDLEVPGGLEDQEYPDVGDCDC